MRERAEGGGIAPLELPMSPTALSSTIFFNILNAGDQTIGQFTASMTPDFFAAAAIERAPSRVAAIGFSLPHGRRPRRPLGRSRNGGILRAKDDDIEPLGGEKFTVVLIAARIARER